MKSLLSRIILVLALVLAGAMAWLWTPDRPRELLEKAYLQRPEDLMSLLGMRVHVRDSGRADAPAIILLHGFGSSLHTFEPWARGLEQTHRIVRFDLPGSGLSDPDPTGRYTDARSMELMIALMDRLGIGRAAIAGNSIGGRLAWTFAAAHPDRTSHLVLIAPDGFASPGFAYGKAPDVPVMLDLMRYALPKSMLRSNLALAYGDPARLDEATLERYHALMLAPGGRQAMIERMRQTILQDPVPVLRTIRAPVLLLWGGKDAMIPVIHAEDYRAVLPRSEVVILPELGHVPHEEAPERSLAPVLEFLTRP
ncbi:alpha/beta fold hydrolase [Rhabdaerophilum sp. SD176]|uniref:alpha/beta fold hydrolase n=1 Tax=Rhabdaerophilum sp. SD176 TaxID=2983548 RepID=UPI0024E01AA6|nr:alpha/beta fold hydrolase [Rhabdaerophilum sp. SD176]